MSNKIVDVKPKNEAVFDVKPSNKVIDTLTDRLSEVVLSAGQSMGLLLTLTYPTATTVSTTKSP